MLSLGEIDALERGLKASIVGLNKKGTASVTLIEAVDEAMLWPEPFEDMAPIALSHSFDNLISRAPLLICAVAAEIGFRFEGVGTVFWAKFSDALGLSVFLVTHDLDTLYTICDRVAVLAEKRVLVADRLDVVAATDNPWIHEYFHGPRGRAAEQAASGAPGSN